MKQCLNSRCGKILISTVGVAAVGGFVYKKRFSTEPNVATVETKSNTTTVPVELPPAVDIYSQEDTSEHSLWWNGVKEISIYLDEENAAIVNSHFTSAYPVVFVLFHPLTLDLAVKSFWR